MLFLMDLQCQEQCDSDFIPSSSNSNSDMMDALFPGDLCAPIADIDSIFANEEPASFPKSEACFVASSFQQPISIPSDEDIFSVDILSDFHSNNNNNNNNNMVLFDHMPPMMMSMMSTSTAPPPTTGSFMHLRPFCAKPKRRVVSDEFAAPAAVVNSSDPIQVSNGSSSRRGTTTSTSSPTTSCRSNNSTNTATSSDLEDRASFIPATKRQRVAKYNGDMFAEAVAGNDWDESGAKFRLYQAEKWQARFQELVNYKEIHGHAQVPHAYTINPTLARWAKRQRYQYKLWQEKKSSTMTEERIAALEDLGFVWDSHTALWEERYNELQEYVRVNGNANVPSTYPPNPKLAIWVKCQRRQYKLLMTGDASNMTYARVDLLNHLKFVWEIRRNGSSS